MKEVLLLVNSMQTEMSCAIFADIVCIHLPAGDPSGSLPHSSISPSPFMSMAVVSRATSWATSWPAPVLGWHSGCEGGQEVGGRRVDSHDAGMKMDQHCSATYDRLWKALFEEDAGRAHNVLQHVAVLDQGAEGFPEQLVLLHVLIAVSLWLLAHRPHLPIRSPLQRHSPVRPPPPAPRPAWLTGTWSHLSRKRRRSLLLTHTLNKIWPLHKLLIILSRSHCGHLSFCNLCGSFC